MRLLCNFPDPYAGMAARVYERNNDGLSCFVADGKQNILTLSKILCQSRQPFFSVAKNIASPPSFNRLMH